MLCAVGHCARNGGVFLHDAGETASRAVYPCTVFMFIAVGGSPLGVISFGDWRPASDVINHSAAAFRIVGPLARLAALLNQQQPRNCTDSWPDRL